MPRDVRDQPAQPHEHGGPADGSPRDARDDDPRSMAKLLVDHTDRFDTKADAQEWLDAQEDC